MDEVIFEEFKGTGNMEVRLDRKLADKRIFPAIDIETTGTAQGRAAHGTRRGGRCVEAAFRAARLDPAAAIELLIKKTRETKYNAEFLTALRKNSR